MASDDATRNLGDFKPDIWGDLFTSFSMDSKLLENYSKEVEALKIQVKAMLTRDRGEAMEKLILINTLERLGIFYLFRNEIEEELEHLFSNYKDMNYDLSTTALHFRIFRQHGYRQSCDVFNKFTDSEFEFRKDLMADVDGMLNLYEAAFLRVHGESMLERALEFTKARLISIAPTLSPTLAEEVYHALDQPVHRAYPRIQTRRFVTFYEKDESRNETLLRLAKMDFNRVQLFYREELKHVSVWWKDLITKAPYTRDRIVESFVWATCGHFEPEATFSRVLIAKAVAWLTIVDDSYDAYGTFEECKLFTNSIQRWSLRDIDQLPRYMRETFREIFILHDEIQKELENLGTTYALHYSIQNFKDIVSRYGKESEWVRDGYMPTMDEYFANHLKISTGFLLNNSFVGMGKIASVESFEWLRSDDNMVIASLVIGRLSNDIAGHKKEQEGKHAPSAVECYMKQYNVSLEEAIESLNKMIDQAWIDINEGVLRLKSALPRPIIETVVNQTRYFSEAYNNRYDRFTNPEGFKDQVMSLFVNPIPLN